MRFSILLYIFVYFRKLLYISGCILLYIFVYYCILLSIIEYYCQLLKGDISYSYFMYIFLYILEKYCIFAYYIMQKSTRIMRLEGFMCFEASLPGLRKQRGGWGGGVAPPICNHNARIIGLERIFICWLKKTAGGLRGAGGGRRSPPFASTMLASWVWKGFIRVEQACPALNKQ